MTQLGERAGTSEIERDRRAEGWLVLKAFVALAVVVGFVIVRELFFA